MGGLFSILIAEHDHGLAGELAALSNNAQVEHRALLRLRENVGHLDALPVPAVREFLRLYGVEIRAEQAYSLSRIHDYEQGGTGRRPYSFVHNLILVAALSEWKTPDIAARRLGPPITAAGVRKARRRALNTARDFLTLVGAAGEDHEAFLERRVSDMRVCLVAAEERLREERADTANARAHPSARRFYATASHDQSDTNQRTPRVAPA